MEIKDILLKYDTDKESFHHYGDVYQNIFSKFDREGQLDILEVGTQKGGSLLAWQDYFPHANITGVDIVDVVSSEYKVNYIRYIVNDIKEFKPKGKFDIIIDDGSHYLADIVYVVSQYIHKLNDGGVIVIEDVLHPDLMLNVIASLFAEIKLGFPDYPDGAKFRVTSYDRRHLAPGSYIIAITKQ